MNINQFVSNTIFKATEVENPHSDKKDLVITE